MSRNTGLSEIIRLELEDGKLHTINELKAAIINRYPDMKIGGSFYSALHHLKRREQIFTTKTLTGRTLYTKNKQSPIFLDIDELIKITIAKHQNLIENTNKKIIEPTYEMKGEDFSQLKQLAQMNNEIKLILDKYTQK